MRKFISLNEAIERLKIYIKPELSSEIVSLEESLGRILAEDVISKIDVPPFDRSTVDGYALISSDTFRADEYKPVELKVIGSVKPGESFKGIVSKGFAVEISTGAPIPKGCDSVIMKEYTCKRGDYVLIYRSSSPGENVMKKGSDIKAGERVLLRGTKLSPLEIGVLAAIGVSKVKVFKRLKVAVFSIGNELVDVGEELRDSCIYDINRSSIMASVMECGCIPLDFGIVKDDEVKIEETIKNAMKEADIIITSAATSAGSEDLLPRILSKIGKPGIIVEGLRTKPGRPTMIALINGKIIFALPGHPSSALMMFDLIVKRVLSMKGGISLEPPSLVKAKLASRVFSEGGITTYFPVKLKLEKGEMIAYPIPRESGAITSLGRADGYVEIPEGRQFIEKGEVVSVRLLRKSLPS